MTIRIIYQNVNICTERTLCYDEPIFRLILILIFKGPFEVVSLSKKLYPYCLVLVGSRNGFERGLT